jgi:arginase family enzyme
MRIVPVLFPCDLASTKRGQYKGEGTRGAPDLMLGMLESEGVRFARPQMVTVDVPNGADAEAAPLKFDEAIAKAIQEAAEVITSVNAEGNFPVILGGDQLAMCAQILAAGEIDGGVGVAVLADAHLDLGTPGEPAYGDSEALKDSKRTWDGDADRMVLAAALRMFPDNTAIGRLMKNSSLKAKQCSVMGVRGPQNAQIKANEKEAAIEVWRMERLELDGETAYRSMLSRHLEMGPIALSVDASGLDPHLMTAVQRSVSDGIDWSFLKRSLEQCVRHVDRLLGLDLCEMDPALDNVNHSSMQRLIETIAPFLRRVTR